MRGGWLRGCAALALTGSLALVMRAAPAAEPAGAAQATRWVASWAASPHQPLKLGSAPAAVTSLKDQTLRQRVRVSLGGQQLRVRFSNEFGAAPLDIAAATLALAASGSGIVAGSVHRLTFGGASSFRVPAGAPAVSDPVDLAVKDSGELAVSVYVAHETALDTVHETGLESGFISKPGDFTAVAELPVAQTVQRRFVLSEIDVAAPAGTGLVVAFGDSITDGAGSSLDANHRWPDFLWERLRAAPGRPHLAVVDEGISGNRLLSDGMGVSSLARFDRDVLALPGVTQVIVLIGINDIGWPGAKFGDLTLASPAEAVTAEQLIGGYRQLIARAHARGVRVLGATLLPFEGTAGNYYTAEKEALRRAANDWIRTSGAFDGVIDFDAAARDAQHPGQIRESFGSQDHLHPGDAGYRALAAAIDLKLLH